MGEPILEVYGLSKRFGELTAVDDISASFPDDSLYAILGPNGAGKTTFFNLLSGVLEPTEGDIFIDGEQINGLPSYEIARKGLARAYQNSELFYQLSVLDNVTVAIQSNYSHYSVTQKTSQEVIKQAEEVLEEVGLSHSQDILAGDLSHGEQRVLEIAIAVATDPRILLLDEPTSGVGPEETVEIIDLIRNVSSQFPIILIEHKMSVVREVADFVMVLNHGRKIADGRPDEVRNNETVREVYLGNEEL